MTLEQENQLCRGTVALLTFGMAQASTGWVALVGYGGALAWGAAFVVATLRLIAPHVGPLPLYDLQETTRVETRALYSVGEPRTREDGATVLDMRWRLGGILHIVVESAREVGLPLRLWPQLFARLAWRLIGQRTEMVITAKPKGER